MKTAFIGLMCLLSFAVTGCNTIKGMGQDIQKAGSAIENASKK